MTHAYPERAALIDWWDRLHEMLGGDAQRKGRKWLHRRFHLSSDVVAWLGDQKRTDADKRAFAELLLRLDADPIGASLAVLRPGALPGTRWAGFGEFRAVFFLNSLGDEVRVFACV